MNEIDKWNHEPFSDIKLIEGLFIKVAVHDPIDSLNKFIRQIVNESS